MTPLPDPPPTFSTDLLSSAALPGLPKRTVLVVDDEPYINLLITSILKLNGCDVLSAANGEQALGVLAEHPQVAAIVTDLHMPKLDGFGLLAALNTHETPLPVVVVTARGADSDQRRSMELGARALLTKPFSRQQLWKVVAPLLGLEDAP
ncbi:response regulator (plasmid) [Deinococcus sp. KNUC1210]|uniref:response regulator n=1 Tax=Deinococcus sp. KNUC1210 TaxID=2917691 RepID=UPI001EF12472|nr:response regulator [Deinococcus sp. KNUC1210]ULH17740.1 response regulator [Deinococcus sp. KNUC1210]